MAYHTYTADHVTVNHHCNCRSHRIGGRRPVLLIWRVPSGGEIISGDSRQVYRGMTLGTGKDLEEYGEVPYHLIDIEDAGTKYNLYGYLRDAAVALDRIESHGAVPVLCGGTGMYVEAFLRGTALPEVPENALLRARLEGKKP